MNTFSYELIVSTVNARAIQNPQLFLLEGVSYLVINQLQGTIDSEALVAFNMPHLTSRLRVFSVLESGLSKSRNMAINLASCDICIVCDDDIWHEPGLVSALEKAFSDSSVDFITFASDAQRVSKRKSRGMHWHSWRSIMQVTSICIAFRRKRFLERGIRFDESFGLGSGQFIDGEEVIFLKDAIDAGLRGCSIDDVLVHHEGPGTGYVMTTQLARSKGALFCRLFGVVGFLVIPLFALRKFRFYKEKIGFFRFLLASFSGAREYWRQRNSLTFSQ